MNKEAFDTLRGVEGTWWDKGRRHAASQVLGAVGVSSGDKVVLDVGAGYGSMYDYLAKYGMVDGFEPEAEVAAVAKKRGYQNFYANEREVLEAGKQYDLIGAFDVLEHVEHDQTFTKDLFSLSKEGGHIVATVPAFQWLWGPHDVSHHHFRRHTVRSMQTLLEGAGYTVVYARYWNVLLFPIALTMRLLGKAGEGSLHPHPIVASILTDIVVLEAKLGPLLRLLRLGGLSVVIVGRKDSK